MEKLTSRIYLDYNATSPFASSVKKWLAKGDFYYANPSSVHTQGKKVAKEIRDVREFLFQTFGLSSLDYGIFFHSGASEGINTILKGFSCYHKAQGEKVHILYLKTDHSSVVNTARVLSELGVETHSIDVDKNGEFNLEEVVEKIKSLSGQAIVNYTWVNNESGVVLPLEKALALKKATNCYLHVDAVQAVGKIADWNRLKWGIDSYTFSAHKFGALKGSGFSFYKNDFKFTPLVNGGGQQNGLRSGTENTLSILSIKLALKEIFENYNYSEQFQGKHEFENKIEELLKDKIEIVGKESSQRNGNTVYFILKEVKAQVSAMAFDLAEIDVSNGSACSSGAVIPSRVLLAMGHSELEALSAIRCSFSPYFNKDELERIWPQVKSVLERYL